MKRHAPCPHLPIPERELDWRHLNEVGTDRGALFYLRCLEYAQHLWLHATPARSLLAVDRALLSDVTGLEPEVSIWPLPYRTVSWIVREAAPGHFLGNPRIHYQHLADRVRGPGQAIKRWRSWACWHLVRSVRPDLPGDPRHQVMPPGETEVAQGLALCGIPGEVELWRSAFG